MFSKVAVAALTVVLCVSLSAQEKKDGTKSVMHDITVTTSESVYTGTMDLAIDMGKVTGKMVRDGTYGDHRQRGRYLEGRRHEPGVPVSHGRAELRRHGEDEHQAVREAGTLDGDGGGSGLWWGQNRRNRGAEAVSSEAGRSRG